MSDNGVFVHMMKYAEQSIEAKGVCRRVVIFQLQDLDQAVGHGHSAAAAYVWPNTS